jgi:type IV secretory pathway VirB9-like protein
MRRLLLTATILAAFSAPAWALTEPQPVNASEPRVRAVEYAPDQVVKIVVPASGETQIILSPDDGKVLFSVPQAAWRHSRAANTLNLAPNPGATTTFAHAVSYLPDGKTRTYTFELMVGSAGSGMVASTDGAVPQQGEPSGYAEVRFTYAAAETQAKAEAAQAAKQAAVQEAKARRTAATRGGSPVVRSRAMAPVRRRCDFMFRGSAAILPQAACDQGDRTTFLWAGEVPVPAIFKVAPDGSEQAVTQAPDPSRPGLIIVPTTSQRWVLRSGKKLAVELFDAAYDPLWNDPVPGADAQPGARRPIWSARR